VIATLATISAAASDAKLESPALLIVGDVVSLHSSLAWFNSGPAPGLSETA
jgi:uroporphyrin-III C-methyltransferase / precorrin-2 dehydrogenase / sirohydrochlorin ferrochelatase